MNRMRTWIMTLACALGFIGTMSAAETAVAAEATAPAETTVAAEATAPAGGDTLKVISYNIRNGKAKDKQNAWKFRKEATVEMLQAQLPDIFGVQEAFEFQVKYIAGELPDYGWYGVGRNNGKHLGECMTIFYNKKKIRLEDKGTFWLSGKPQKPSYGWDAMCKRTATWALMTHLESGRQFIFVNTHLDHVSRMAQRKGLELILDFITQANEEFQANGTSPADEVTPANGTVQADGASQVTGAVLANGASQDNAGLLSDAGDQSDGGRALADGGTLVTGGGQTNGGEQANGNALVNDGGLPVVLTGDFNVSPEDDILKALDGKMVSVREAADKTDQVPSFNGWGHKAATIDYIYQSGFRSMAEFRTITDPYAGRPYISDHYPIAAWLVF